ncbi:MAG: nitroreductase family protein [Verrucomicrobia bacterium]|nr:nitroreductase family protein [Verrucomicrobiota bacterium]
MKAVTDYPVHDLIATRWSPYSFANRTVSDDDLRSLFEAARWAASSYNEQPWSYILAKKEDAAEFERLLSCLVEPNQVWARFASALALGISSLNFARDKKPNRAAVHDLGLAAGSLLLEATSRGLAIHQMIGILPDKARELYSIPEGCEPMTAIAIGYAGVQNDLPENVRTRDAARRPRKQLKEFVFGGKWGVPSKLV